jgi:hypothetical protein
MRRIEAASVIISDRLQLGELLRGKEGVADFSRRDVHGYDSCGHNRLPFHVLASRSTRLFLSAKCIGRAFEVILHAIGVPSCAGQKKSLVPLSNREVTKNK